LLFRTIQNVNYCNKKITSRKQMFRHPTLSKSYLPHHIAFPKANRLLQRQLFSLRFLEMKAVFKLYYYSSFNMVNDRSLL